MAYLMREKFEQRPDPELLNCVLDAIIVIGPSLELTYANDAAKAYLALVAPGDGRSDGDEISAMRLVHPDLASGDGAAARRLNEAFGVLEPVFRRHRPLPPPTRTTSPRRNRGLRSASA